jgi:hypothetical protein
MGDCAVGGRKCYRELLGILACRLRSRYWHRDRAHLHEVNVRICRVVGGYARPDLPRCGGYTRPDLAADIVQFGRPLSRWAWELGGPLPLPKVERLCAIKGVLGRLDPDSAGRVLPAAGEAFAG